ncbi:hypothetical protein DAPPUDRAFT_258005 [Daphnia pulex]|uniref:Uncharacterized protein n=1 Tax=Daphnia pulex TaxID=6669 RepID=E9HEM4_DAPPU|nr:hypothetical protein DAPPUDRAFT_258005 [Daphnia pulex]|eukprot:EFX69782.1 hypothetical protein DAPPUDRAFT_258005 [Daphnia pulex]
MFSAHSTRGAAASKAIAAGISVDTVLLADHPETTTLSEEEAGDIVVEETKSRIAISWTP